MNLEEILKINKFPKNKTFYIFLYIYFPCPVISLLCCLPSCFPSLNLSTLAQLFITICSNSAQSYGVTLLSFKCSKCVTMSIYLKSSFGQRFKVRRKFSVSKSSILVKVSKHVKIPIYPKSSFGQRFKVRRKFSVIS